MVWLYLHLTDKVFFIPPECKRQLVLLMYFLYPSCSDMHEITKIYMDEPQISMPVKVVASVTVSISLQIDVRYIILHHINCSYVKPDLKHADGWPLSERLMALLRQSSWIWRLKYPIPCLPDICVKKQIMQINYAKITKTLLKWQ